MLKAEALDCLVGRGCYYGSGSLEPTNATGKTVFVVGGGNSAGQAALYISRYAKSVTLLARGQSLEMSMSDYLVRQISTRANMTVECETTVSSVSGGARLQTICTRTQRTEKERSADVLYLMIGAEARTGWLPASIERNEDGFVLTGRDLKPAVRRPDDVQPFHLETLNTY